MNFRQILNELLNPTVKKNDRASKIRFHKSQAEYHAQKINTGINKKKHSYWHAVHSAEHDRLKSVSENKQKSLPESVPYMDTFKEYTLTENQNAFRLLNRANKYPKGSHEHHSALAQHHANMSSEYQKDANLNVDSNPDKAKNSKHLAAFHKSKEIEHRNFAQKAKNPELSESKSTESKSLGEMMVKKVSKPPSPKTAFEKALAARYKKQTLKPFKESYDESGDSESKAIGAHRRAKGHLKKARKHQEGTKEYHTHMAGFHSEMGLATSHLGYLSKSYKHMAKSVEHQKKAGNIAENWTPGYSDTWAKAQGAANRARMAAERALAKKREKEAQKLTARASKKAEKESKEKLLMQLAHHDLPAAFGETYPDVEPYEHIARMPKYRQFAHDGTLMDLLNRAAKLSGQRDYNTMVKNMESDLGAESKGIYK